jgi:Asp-tRNA(Asn)/Glu-tRNA(Gln) amidotransferase A subunit family amidase
MNTTAGSFALVGSVPQGDSTMVAKLRAAGAIILAKANLSRKMFSPKDAGIPKLIVYRMG